MATLYFYSYNNYYNRQVKKLNSLSDYTNYLVYFESGTNVNFNPNDGVNTVVIAGRQNNPYNGKGDYVIYSEDNVNITSRWFIIEQTRTLKNQYRVELHRDVICDYYDQLVQSPVFIEKATLTEDNPLIYNQEGITVNQIKTKETLLKDETNCSWIVGYYDSKYREKDATGVIMQATIQQEIAYDEAIAGTYLNWGYSKYDTIDMIGPTNILNYHLYATDTSYAIAGGDFYYPLDYKINPNVGRASELIYEAQVINPTYPYYTDSPKTANQIWNDFRELGWSTLKQQFDQLVYTVSQSDVDILKSYKGKIVRFGDGAGGYEYYKFDVTEDTSTHTKTVTEGQLYTTLRGKFDNVYSFVESIQHPAFSVDYKGSVLRLIAQKLQVGKTQTQIKDTAYALTDAPYGMFAIPYGQVTIKNTGGSFTSVDIVPETSYRVANELAKNYAGGKVLYDLQLLPYCPCRQIILSDGTLDINNNGALFSPITDEQNNVLGVILHASVSSFTLNIPFSIPVVNKKLENETDMYRLVSPNYNGQFEFSAAKNDGVANINVDCTYKPYNPYIHLNPDFDNLYGEDFNDARGLICGGDFSLPIINDQFKAYEIQNKNYENIFRREIQNIDYNRKYQRLQEGVGLSVGAAQGAGAGAFIGSQIVPGIGTAIGGIIGGAASLAGGAVDIAISDKLYTEAVNYKTDMFGYQLDNIKALPYSISKTTAYVYNNKIFPILEYYTCTSKEKIAVANKIAWNGMSVGVIDKIINYIDNTWSYEGIEDKGYIKGRLIRLDNIYDDFHLINAISDEIYKGAYFK